MRIYVCVKHVPDSGALIELSGEKSFVEANVKFIPNPFDEYGVEEALRLRGEDGEVIVVCAGNVGALSSIHAALAMGADRAVHVLTEGLFTDSVKMGKAVAQAIKQDGTPDIVFTGKQSIDGEGGRFPYVLARELGMPVINDVSGLELSGGKAVALCDIGGGARRRMQAALPCVVGAARGLNEPRYPKLPDIMKARKKPVRQVPAASFDLGETFAPVLEKLELAPERAGARMFEGDMPTQVRELLRVLREEEKVL